MTVRELIFEDFRNAKEERSVGSLWRPQTYRQFQNGLPAPFRKVFDDELNALCEEGLFERVDNGLLDPILRLTEKGFHEIWKDVM